VEKDIDGTHVPQLVDTLPTIKQISCESEFTISVSESGDVFAFGCNHSG